MVSYLEKVGTLLGVTWEIQLACVRKRREPPLSRIKSGHRIIIVMSRLIAENMIRCVTVNSARDVTGGAWQA